MKAYVEPTERELDIKFHGTNLMGKKPPINPYNIFEPDVRNYKYGARTQYFDH